MKWRENSLPQALPNTSHRAPRSTNRIYVCCEEIYPAEDHKAPLHIKLYLVTECIRPLLEWWQQRKSQIHEPTIHCINGTALGIAASLLLGSPYIWLHAGLSQGSLVLRTSIRSRLHTSVEL